MTDAGPDLVAWVLDACCATRLVLSTPIHGGIVSAVNRLRLARPDGTTVDVVVKRWSDADGSTRGQARREADALAHLAETAVPAPSLVALDALGDDAGQPCLVMTAVDGEPELRMSPVGELANMQARIHALSRGELAAAEQWFDEDRPRSWIADPGLRVEAVAIARQAAREPDAFVHGDYQPFNVLWHRSDRRRIVGVVDWTMAGAGRRGTDVGHCRLNLAALFGAEVADRYLLDYERAAGVPVDPADELRALLAWAPDWLDFLPRQIAGRADVDLSGCTPAVNVLIADAVRRAGRLA